MLSKENGISVGSFRSTAMVKLHRGIPTAGRAGKGILRVAQRVVASTARNDEHLRREDGVELGSVDSECHLSCGEKSRVRVCTTKTGRGRARRGALICPFSAMRRDLA
jgi:hypothetical protein